MARIIRPIVLQAFNQGGVSESKYSGPPNSSAKLIGWDIHSEPGILKANQRMSKISAATVAAFCKERVAASNGIRYWFSSTDGKIWQDKAGTITLVYTVSPSGGGAAILGAIEYQDYIYFFTESRIHRIAVANADGAANWAANISANWASFANGDASYHPCIEISLVLYIGDSNYVAQIDGDTFSNQALDISSQYRVSALGKLGTDLLVGTIIATTVSYCEIFRWNTWAVSFTNEDTVYEPGINAFLETDNYVIVNAGLAGNLYSYNGQVLEFYKKIPGTYTPTAQAKVNPSAIGLFNGFLPIFGVSNVQGNPCDQGVWSLGKHSNSYPTVLNLEFPTSNIDIDSYNILTGIEIGAVMVSGQDVYMSWRKSITITVTIASPGVVTSTTHGLTDGDAIIFSTTSALPTGITAGTTYYIKSIDANTFNLYDTAAHAIAGGATGRVNTSGSQSGVHTGMTFGIDKLDYSNKILHPILETRNIDPFLSGFTTFKQFIVTYENELPSGTTLLLKNGKNGVSASTSADIVLVNDADRAKMSSHNSQLDARTLQLRLEATTSANNTPKVQQVIIDFEGVNVPV